MTNLLLPLAALVVALLIIAALWLWWSGERSDEAQPQAQSGHPSENLHNEAPVPSIPITTVDSPHFMPEPPEPGRFTAPSPAPLAAYSADELLRAVRAPDGRLSVLFGGVTYHSMGEITDSELRKQFMGVLRALAQFTQDVDNGVAAPDAPVQTFASTIPQVQPYAASSANSTSPMLASEAEAAEPEPQSMAGQIEALLQTRLMRTPGMQHRSIHIYGAPGGGVQINVDGACFDSVGDVTDSEVRAVIEAAIHDWESANPL